MPTETESATAADILGDLNAYQLAQRADVTSPDSLESPGARFLVSVYDATVEMIDEGNADDEDRAHEIADNAPDVYTHARWLEFVDLCAYNEDVTELGADPSDLTACAGVALYMIAERLVQALLAEYRDAIESD